MRKLLVMFTLLLGMLALPLLASGLTASAEPGSNDRPIDFCRAADEGGNLDKVGVTFGECLIAARGQITQSANIFAAGVCGVEEVQELAGTTNKGQCIKVGKGSISQP